MKKRVFGLLLVVVMLVTLMAPALAASTEKRNIVIGLWWDKYYDSTHESLESNPSYSGNYQDQLMFEVVKKIEEKYNVTIEYVNLTYTGTQESINTSIVAGTPDCDIYLVDTTMGIPAAMNGLCVDLKTILPADSDVLDKQVVMNYLNIGDGKATLFKPVAAQTVVEATYPLMFNKQMLEDANLEDPRELYKRGEWTWDKFISYCQALTKDTNGDGVIDVYGYGGFQSETFDCLMMSNGTHVATGATENFSSPEVGEVLKLMQDMYLVYNCAYPYDPDGSNASNTMRFLYRDGKCAFSPGAAWVLGQNADYDYNGTAGTTLDFDMCFCEWPVGPSGNQETNRMKLCGGEFYMIPVGVEDPELVYNVFYDFSNWYDFDTSIRDDETALNWWYTVTAKDMDIQDRNFEVMFECGMREQFDLVDSLGITPDYYGLFQGTYTPAQFQETYRQQYQDALDGYYK